MLVKIMLEFWTSCFVRLRINLYSPETLWCGRLTSPGYWYAIFILCVELCMYPWENGFLALMGINPLTEVCFADKLHVCYSKSEIKAVWYNIAYELPFSFVNIAALQNEIQSLPSSLTLLSPHIWISCFIYLFSEFPYLVLSSSILRRNTHLPSICHELNEVSKNVYVFFPRILEIFLVR